MKIRPTYFQLCTLLFVLTVAVTVQAGNWSTPALDARTQQLWLVNASAQTELAWVTPAHEDANTNAEIGLELAPWSRQQVDVSALAGSPWLQVKARDGAGLQVMMNENGRWVSIPEGRTNKRGLQTSRGEAVFVTNLSPISQDGEIVVQLRNGGLWRQTFQMLAFESAKVSLPEFDFVQIEVRASMAITAWIWSPQGTQYLKPLKQDEYLKMGDARFVLANPAKTQSFVVELTDPDMIRQAREQIQSPDDFRARILFAEIGPTPNQTNQDLSNWGRGSWSWHVSRPIKFGELASQACDGSPEFIEDFLAAWLKSGSIICFWNYKVVQEL